MVVEHSRNMVVELVALRFAQGTNVNSSWKLELLYWNNIYVE